MGKYLNRYISKEDIQQTYQKVSSTTNHERKANQTHSKCQLLEVNVTKHEVIGAGKVVGERELLSTVVGAENWCFPYRKQYRDSSKH